MAATPILPILFCVLAALPVLLFAGAHLHRRALLARLGGVLGQAQAMPGAGPAAWLVRAGEKLPGMADTAFRVTAWQAGYFHPAALPLLGALRAALVLAGLVLPLAVGGQSGARLFLAILFCGFFASRLFLAGLRAQARARMARIRREMPPLVDVLLMTLGSGISIDQALRHVAGLLERPAPNVAQVLRLYAADIDHGLPYEAAFERLGQRLAVDEGYDLAAMIKGALLRGGEIVGALQRFGDEVSEKRVALAREQVGRRAILLTIVMLLFFMPVLLVVLGGPAVATIMDTLSSVKQQLHDKEAGR